MYYMFPDRSVRFQSVHIETENRKLFKAVEFCTKNMQVVKYIWVRTRHNTEKIYRC